MQLLDSSMDKIADRVYHQLRSTIPEQILGKMSVAVSQAISSEPRDQTSLVIRLA